MAAIRDNFDLRRYGKKIRNQATEIERLTAEVTELKELLKDANCALRSAAQIAQRDGESTNWDAFRSRLAKVLLAQHKYMYPDTDSGSPEPKGNDSE